MNPYIVIYFTLTLSYGVLLQVKSSLDISVGSN